MTSIWDWRIVLEKDIKKLLKMKKYEQKQYALAQTIKVGSIRKFGGKCGLCHLSAEHNPNAGWLFHHYDYFDFELTHRHFKRFIGRQKKPNPDFLFKNEDYVDQLDFDSLYRLEAIKQVRKTPSNFAFLDNPHHQFIERLDKFRPENVKRAIQIWKKTKTRWINK